MRKKISEEFEIPNFTKIKLTFSDDQLTHYNPESAIINFNMEQYQYDYELGAYNEYVKVASKIDYKFGFVKIYNNAVIPTTESDKLILIHELAHALVQYCWDYNGDVHGKIFCKTLNTLMGIFNPKLNNPFKTQNF